MFWVYIIRTADNRLYIGHTQSLERREWEHHVHIHGAKFLKNHVVKFSVVYTEGFQTRTEAMRREGSLDREEYRVVEEALITAKPELFDPSPNPLLLKRLRESAPCKNIVKFV